jgi:surface protein
MFDNAVLFNTDISKWVLPEVVAMSYLFHGATSFNIDVSKWLTKTSKVTSLGGVFHTATAFNQPLTNWDTSKITTMYEMFYKASSFNGGKVFVFFRQLILFGTFQFFSPYFFFSPKTDVSTWATSKVTTFEKMFHSAAAFNGGKVFVFFRQLILFGTFQFFSPYFFFSPKTDVSTWATSKVTTFEKMFHSAAAFNADVSKWNLNAAASMDNMFQNSAFDRTICGDKWLNLNAFDNSNGRHGCCNAGSYMSTPHVDPFNATEACATCSDTNAVVSFGGNSDVACPTIQDMVATWFTDQGAAIAKYGSIENWDTSKVTDMSNLFEDATAFNGGNKRG